MLVRARRRGRARPRNDVVRRSKRAESTTSASQIRSASSSSRVPNGGVLEPPQVRRARRSAAAGRPAPPGARRRAAHVQRDHLALRGARSTAGSSGCVAIGGVDAPGAHAAAPRARRSPATGGAPRSPSLARCARASPRRRSARPPTSVITQLRGCGCSSSPTSARANFLRMPLSALEHVADGHVLAVPVDVRLPATSALTAGATPDRPPASSFVAAAGPHVPAA